MFWTAKPDPLSTDDVRRLGRLEAQVETLELKWKLYRDEMRKLVQRLEKQTQRAEAKQRAQDDETMINEDNGTQLGVDEVTARVMHRRNRALPS